MTLSNKNMGVQDQESVPNAIYILSDLDRHLMDDCIQLKSYYSQSQNSAAKLICLIMKRNSMPFRIAKPP